MPRVTVVIPTYNRAALVMEAAGSVLRQTYRDFEVVVCDDGSTDETAARVATLGPPARYVALDHSGCPGRARNRGVEAARGDLVTFLDDDDLWEPNKLARQIEVLDANPDLNMIYTDRRLLDATGSVPAAIRTPALERADRLIDLVLSRQMPCVCTWLVRRELLLQVHGFDEALVSGEDLDLLLRMAPLARAAGVPEPLVVVRRQPASVSEQAGSLTFENAVRVLQRWLADEETGSSNRRRANAMVALLNARLAAALATEGDVAGSLRAAVRAIRHAPASGGSWAAGPRAVRAML